ncbi:MAG TPA: hypothetical protein VF989_01330 [Polyangiaceae bacterium]
MTERAGDLERLGQEPTARFVAELSAALRRRPAQEARLAGVVRALAPYSTKLRGALVAAVETLVRRGSYDRVLYASAVRSLCEASDARATEYVARALSSEASGGLVTLSAATLCRDLPLGKSLARAAVGRPPHLAFGAELARVARGDADGRHVASLAPMIKESHRIAMCVEVFVPLSWAPPLPSGAQQALAVLRDQERHLGRWLLLAELGARAGDPGPSQEAERRACEGPQSARAAWSLVAWALDPKTPPGARPTVELVSRLSDRPSAHRDATFLYRLAAGQVDSARSMLETFAKGKSLATVTGIRSALYLARDHGRDDLRGSLLELAQSTRREPLRGLAAAALYDAGSDVPVDLCAALERSKHLSTAAWALLIGLRRAGHFRGDLVSEATLRRVQLGWVE